MHVEAAILSAFGQPFEIRTLDIAAPNADEVLVRLTAVDTSAGKRTRPWERAAKRGSGKKPPDRRSGGSDAGFMEFGILEKLFACAGHSAVTGSMTALIALTASAGKPPRRACSRISSGLGER